MRRMIQFARTFHRFLEENGNWSPIDLAELCRLREAIGKLNFLGTAELTERQKKRLERMFERFEELATGRGCEVCFSNPYPAIKIEGRYLDIPC